VQLSKVRKIFFADVTPRATSSYTAPFRKSVRRTYSEVFAVNGRNGTRNRRAREQALLAAATKLFASRGFEATTTREIAAQAGCAEGLIHRYFRSKAGLLLAIIQCRISQEVVDLGEKATARKVQDEILQLVDWEVDRMWDDREFLRVIIPRALLDRHLLGPVSTLGPLQRAKAIAERLRKFKECRSMTKEELEALGHFIGVMGFMFGFMRPVVLRHDRSRARKTAATIASMLARGLEC
jgi:AcrR family transcriptional regulator